MHHYPLAKGDPLCPLGFHPQVRWPTRCKRCFRDYKEHGGRKKEDDFASSSPSLSSWNSSPARNRDDSNGIDKNRTGRNWSSSQNLSNQDTNKEKSARSGTGLTRSNTSWTSTPDLAANEVTTAVTVSLKLPVRRRQTAPLDTGQGEPEIVQNSITVKKTPTPTHLTINKNDSLAERVRKMQMLKKQNSVEKIINPDKEREKDRRSSSRSREEEKTKDDVNFLIQVKKISKDAKNLKINAISNSVSKPPIRGGPSKESDPSDDESTTGTFCSANTEATLTSPQVKEYEEQVESLKNEMATLRKRCERVEKEKSDILLRRLANLDTPSSKLSGRNSELTKLQQKVNDLTTQNDDLKDEKNSLSLKIAEMETALQNQPSVEAANRQVEQLRSKLLAAETLCEELMDENEDMKKELRELEEEIEEMQDNFREDQADEYTTLRREIEQATKNCRVLSFKLKKTERRADQLEREKAEQENKLLELAGGQSGLDRMSRIKELEQELSRSNEVAMRLQRELQEANTKLQQPANQKRNPSLATIGKTPSTEGKVSRASLTRGGSQEEPQQLLRDLQDSLEREADLREQLRNAEEEANNLRKRATRLEDDNESLLLQLKKMATKARTRRLSPTPPAKRLSIEVPIEKDEGISDEEDPAELRILLDMSEQEATDLRRKVEELEQENDSLKRQVKELSEKIASSASKRTTSTNIAITKKISTKSGDLSEEKVKVLEDEIAELRIKLIEKERNCERLHAELEFAQKKPKNNLIKSKSLDGNTEQQNVDLKRQLQVIEQEANVLRSKTQSLEAENEKLQTENRKIQLLKNTKSLKVDKSIEQNIEKIVQLEKDLKEAHNKIKILETSKQGEKSKIDTDANKIKEEFDKLKIDFGRLEKENKKLTTSLKDLKEDAIKTIKPRIPKKPTDLTTKLQLKRMVEDLEGEIGELYVIMKNAHVDISAPSKQKQFEKDVEEIRNKLSKTESDTTNEKNILQTEIAKLKDINLKLEQEKKELTAKLKKSNDEVNSAKDDKKCLQEDKKKLENQIDKLCADLKSSSSKQTAMSDCMKKIEELKLEIETKDKELEKMKKLVENVKNLEQDKNKLIKEIGDKAKKIVELEKKLKESEDKVKRTDKQLGVKKEKVTKLEKELSEEKVQVDALTTNQRRLSVEWITEKDELQAKLIKTEAKLITVEAEMKQILLENESEILTLESNLAAKDVHIKQLEEALRETSNQKYDEAISSLEMAQLQEKLDNTLQRLEQKEDELTKAKKELNVVKDELEKQREELTLMKKEFSILDNEKKDLENNLKTQKKEAGYWESKASELETDLQAERKKVDRMRVSHDKDVKNKEAELATLRGRLRTLEQTAGAGAKKVSELRQEFDENVKKLEHSIAVSKQDYDDLTGKYEVLEEEHVLTKARLTIEKENVQGQLMQVQKELKVVSGDLKALQENYNRQTDAWLKEKDDFQDEIFKLEERLCGGGWEVEKARLTSRLESAERTAAADRDSLEVTQHQLDCTKRELDDVKQKLEDYEKIHKVERSYASENAEMERHVHILEQKLQKVEQSRRAEIAETKQRLEGQLQSVQEEVKSLQAQVSRFRRERDNYKQMLDAATKSSASAANVRDKRGSVSSCDEEEWKHRVAALEEQINCLEEELCESRAVAAKLKTDLVTERTDFEIKIADLQSKLNEVEEDRVVGGGGARIAGAGTRMELAWQKERDRLQRLLRDTATLARDLRHTLFEMERERDKERLDAKRRIEQLKKATEEENEENKKKVVELQCDLLELRDAHAKLRTTNEKLRRDRDKHDRDRDQSRQTLTQMKRVHQDDERKLINLLEQVDEVMKLAQGHRSHSNSNLLTPTPPTRNRSKSRSREATPESVPNLDGGLQTALARLQKASEELKLSRGTERLRQMNSRRAMSTEPRDVMTVTPRIARAPPRSLSLEQTAKDQASIWKSMEDGSVSSIQSIENDHDATHYTMPRDNSMDSRLSGGSTQSDVLPEKKKKKGFLGKLKKLTKSRSIDDQADVPDFKPIGSVSQGSDSDMSAAGSKRDIRGRFSDMFKKGGGSRGNSVSKELATPLPERSTAAQRTLQSNISSARSDASINFRAASATPAMQRKGY